MYVNRKSWFISPHHISTRLRVRHDWSDWAAAAATISWFSKPGSMFLLCKIIQFVSVFLFHLQLITYDICLSVSDLLHKIWWCLGPCLLLQVVLFHSFYDWVTLRCVQVQLLLYPFICRRMFWWLPGPSCCEWCCSEGRGALVFSNEGFL